MHQTLDDRVYNSLLDGESRSAEQIAEQLKMQRVSLVKRSLLALVNAGKVRASPGLISFERDPLKEKF